MIVSAADVAGQLKRDDPGAPASHPKLGTGHDGCAEQMGHDQRAGARPASSGWHVRMIARRCPVIMHAEGTARGHLP